MTAMVDISDDKKRLIELESILQNKKTQFYELGRVLIEISERKLYRIDNYRTFEAYCKEKWSISRPRAYQLIDSKKTVDALDGVAEKEKLTEFVVRELARLKDPEEKRAAFQDAERHAVVEGKPVAARHAKTAVDRVWVERQDQFSSLIKPTDNWTWPSLVYAGLDMNNEGAGGEEAHGYLPGEVYCNALWYYTREGDTVVEPMAGSGQIWRVYEDRAYWMRPTPWDLNIKTFDINPRGPYADRIGKWDMTQGWPLDYPADYIFMDIPYLGMCQDQYSDSPDDIANQGEGAWTCSIQKIAWSCACGQDEGGLVTVVTPNWRDTDEGSIVMTTMIVIDAFRAAGYTLHDKAYQSRRVQQAQGPRAATLNNIAKANKTMLTDISEVLTFRRK